MAIKTIKYTVGTTAVKLSVQDDYRLDHTVAVRNRGAATVYVGGPDVTVAEGFPVEPGEAFDHTDDSPLYAIAAVAGQEVRTFQGGVKG